MSEPVIAEIRIFAGNFAPRNWAFCNGQLLPIAQNTTLFSLIGTTYGGDGRTTTALPNLQGRAPMHPGRGPGLTTRRLGESGGSETTTLTEAQMPSHTHGLMGAAEDPNHAQSRRRSPCPELPVEEVAPISMAALAMPPWQSISSTTQVAARRTTTCSLTWS